MRNMEKRQSIFDGRYSWDGKKKGRREPVAWFPGAYDLKIINLAAGKKNVIFLKPYLCIYTNTGMGYSISENPEKFAKNICSDFGLEMEKVIWVEQIERGKDIFEIVNFERCGIQGNDPVYLTKKRRPHNNENRLIKEVLNVSQD